MPDPDCSFPVNFPGSGAHSFHTVSENDICQSPEVFPFLKFPEIFRVKGDDSTFPLLSGGYAAVPVHTSDKKEVSFITDPLIILQVIG